MTTVADVMTRSIIAVRPDTGFREMARMMVRHQVGALLVVKPASGRLVGIVTEADLMTKPALGPRANGDLALIWEESAEGAEWVRRALGLNAVDVMTTEVIHVSPEASMEEAAALMMARRLKHLPVVDGSKVVGVLARRDLLRTFDRSERQLTGEVLATIRSLVGSGPGPALARLEAGVVTLSADGCPARQIAAVEHSVAAIPGVVAVRVQ
ncbi:MAG TPA: CBS domain-containing protein [Acidimicrobiales bacterium]|nr:CBS domain-containing protein [Acidimicrobiales bacterium]